jgi:hypothetical protein
LAIKSLRKWVCSQDAQGNPAANREVKSTADFMTVAREWVVAGHGDLVHPWTGPFANERWQTQLIIRAFRPGSRGCVGYLPIG